MSGARGPILARGFLVLSRLPSKSLLDAHIPEIFRDVKIGTKLVKLVMGYFYNKLGTLSRKYYTILDRYAINAGFGYILPVDRAHGFLREVDKLKEEYAEYERQLKEFLLTGEVPPEVEENARAKVYREYLEIVREYLRQHGSEEVFRRKVEELSIVDRVRVLLVPFSLSPDIVEEVVDEKVRERIEREIEAVRREVAQAVTERIRERAREILAKLEKLAKTEVRRSALERMRREVEELEREVEAIGIEKPPVLAALKDLLSEEGVARLAEEVATGRSLLTW